MASIPLVALNVKQPESPLQQYATLQQLLGQRTENQTRQVQLQQAQQSQTDQQAQTAAMKEWDGVDYNKLPSLVLKNGGSANAVYAATQHIQDLRAKTSDIAAKDAETNSKNLDALIKTNDEYRGRLQSIITAPADQKQQLWESEVAQEEQAGKIKQGAVPHVYPGDDQATVYANHFALGSVLAKEAAENMQAQARKQTSDTVAGEFAAKQNPQSPLYSPSLAAVAMGTAPGAQQIQAGQAAQAGAVAGAEAKAKQPYQMQLEQIRQQVGQTFQNNKDATDKIESNVLKPYEEKMTSIAQLQSAVQQASQGNVTAARAVALKLIGVTNPDGTKRYNEAEAERLINQGNVPQRIQSTVKNLLTGNNWTSQMEADMVSFGDAQGAVAASNLNRGIQNVNKLYGTSVGSGLSQTPPSQAKTLGGSPPADGFTRIQASDGSMHDIPSGNIAGARKIDPNLKVIQ